MSTTKPLPKTIMLGGTTYKVSLVKGLRSTDGATLLFGAAHNTKPLIEIEADLAVERQWQVMWHELLHHILNNAGLREAHDELVIEAVSTQINWLLIQNGAALLPMSK